MSSMGTSFLSMMEARMPPGFRFHPRDEELINDYLARKISGGPNGCTPMMIDVDLNKIEPWELPEEACVGGKEWYFYSLRDRKYATGQRTNRATVSGYWKATGKDRQVVDGRRGGRLVGMRKTLVFYKGRAPKGKKTDWVMHEFRMEGSNNDALTARSGIDHYNKPSSSSSTSSKEDWVLCRVFYKSRGLSAKPSGTATTAAAPAGSENCYDDTGSSLPPLMDTFINFEQPHHQHQLAAYMQHQQQGSAAAYPHHPQQVPCFSSLLPSSSSNSHRHLPAAFQHHLPSQLPPVDPSMPIRSLTQLVSLPDISPYLSSLSRMEGVRKTEDVAAPPANNNLGGADGSSESFLTEAGAGGGGQPMWSSY